MAALDPSDSVGIIDSYFPGADFFTEFERFDRHIDKLKRSGNSVEYVSICSPNYLHDAHTRFGLRQGADVICEKPLVLNPRNITPLERCEQEYGKRIYNILQLRLHPAIVQLKNKVANQNQKIHDVDLTYITSRGNWYYASWKGNESKSGGIATNIGIHFFDMLIYIFGAVVNSKVNLHSHDRAAGFLQLEKANIRWFLSINEACLPDPVNFEMRTYRSISIDGEEVEFSKGFTNLHTESYKDILAGQGFTIKDTIAAIEVASQIRESQPIGLSGEYHPLAKLEPSVHPFRH